MSVVGLELDSFGYVGLANDGMRVATSTTCTRHASYYHFDRGFPVEIRLLALRTRSKETSSEFISMTDDACLLASLL